MKQGHGGTFLTGSSWLDQPTFLQTPNYLSSNDTPL